MICYHLLSNSSWLHEIRYRQGAPPWTALGELTALPRPHSRFKKAYF